MTVSTQAPQQQPLEVCEQLTDAFDLLGKRWTALIVDLLLQRPARFSELARSVPGLSERVMTARLRELVEAGLVDRTLDSGPPIAATYSLTPLGERLRPGLEALRTWAKELPDASGSGRQGGDSTQRRASRSRSRRE